MNICDWSETKWPSFMATYVLKASWQSSCRLIVAPSDEAFHVPSGFQLLLSVWAIYWSAAICRAMPDLHPACVHLCMTEERWSRVLFKWQMDTLLVGEDAFALAYLKSCTGTKLYFSNWGFCLFTLLPYCTSKANIAVFSLLHLPDKISYWLLLTRHW